MWVSFPLSFPQEMKWSIQSLASISDDKHLPIRWRHLNRTFGELTSNLVPTHSGRRQHGPIRKLIIMQSAGTLELMIGSRLVFLRWSSLSQGCETHILRPLSAGPAPGKIVLRQFFGFQPPNMISDDSTGLKCDIRGRSDYVMILTSREVTSVKTSQACDAFYLKSTRSCLYHMS